ncbi:MAG: hypothetical protein KDA32_03140 [Phycisphaerales bacterium]|nr:hypothetical protein [Phycisphaerales bacterium]
MQSHVGRVLAIARKSAVGGPMIELESADVATQGTLEGGPPTSVDRGVTLMSAAQWKAACAEINADVPWTTRRANVLVEVDRLGPLIGKRARLGSATLHITGETKPCDQMEHAQAGLLRALVPEQRGGVTARVDAGGSFKVGDVLMIENSESAS